MNDEKERMDLRKEQASEEEMNLYDYENPKTIIEELYKENQEFEERLSQCRKENNALRIEKLNLDQSLIKLCEEQNKLHSERDMLKNLYTLEKAETSKLESELITSKGELRDAEKNAVTLQQNVDIANRNYWLLKEECDRLQSKLGYIPFLKEFIAIMNQMLLYNRVVEEDREKWVAQQAQAMSILLNKIGVKLYKSAVGSAFDHQRQICKPGCTRDTDDKRLHDAVADTIQYGIECDDKILVKEQIIRFVFDKNHSEE